MAKFQPLGPSTIMCHSYDDALVTDVCPSQLWGRTQVRALTQTSAAAFSNPHGALQPTSFSWPCWVYLPATGLPSTATTGQPWAVMQGKAVFEKKGSVLAVSGRAAGGVRRGSDPRSADGRPVSAFPFSLPFTAFPSEQCNDWTGCEVVCVTAGGTGAGAAGTSRACSSAARLRRALRIRGCCWPARLPSTGETSLYSQSVYLPPTGLPSTATAGQSWAVSQGKAVFQRRKAAF